MIRRRDLDTVLAALDGALARRRPLTKEAAGLVDVLLDQALSSMMARMALAGDAAAVGKVVARRLAQSASPEYLAGDQAYRAEALARTGAWDEAGRVADAIGRPDARDRARGDIILALVRAGRDDEARKRISGIVNDIARLTAIGIVATPLLRVGDRDAALRRIAELNPPEIGLGLTSAQRARVLATQFADAVALRSLESDFTSVRGATAGFLEQAHEPWHIGYAWGLIARALGAEGEALRNRLLADVENQTDVSGLVVGLVWAGDRAGARRLAARIKDRDDRSGGAFLIAADHAHAGEAADAEKVLNTISTRPIRAIASAEVARLLAERGDRSAAQRLLARASSDLAGVRDPHARFLALAARVAAHQILDKQAPAALAAEMDRIATAKHPGLAEGYFDQSLAAIRLLCGDLPGTLAVARRAHNTALYAAVARAQVKAGDPGAARQTLERGLDDILRRGSPSEMDMQELAREAAEMGRGTIVAAWLDRLPNDPLRIAMLIGRAEGEAGRLYPPVPDPPVGPGEWVLDVAFRR